MGVTLKCLYCKEEFTVRAYRRDTAKFCSRSCLGKARLPEIEGPRLAAIRGQKPHNYTATKKTCAWCKTEFDLPPSHAKKAHFCSRACYTEFLKNPTKQRGYIRVTIDGRRDFLHRHIMRKKLNRELLPDEHVHHLDHDIFNNSPDNLSVIKAGMHIKHHQKERIPRRKALQSK